MSEFYVGWADRAPARLSKWLVAVAAGAVVLAPVVLGGLAWVQRPRPDGTFEFGSTRTFEGDLRIDPLPMLRVTPPGHVRPAGALPLVGSGKFGIPASLAALDGRKVRFPGKLIHRRGVAMVEVGTGSGPEDLGPASAPDGPDSFSTRIQLVGELVDTKCWLGVMRPATGKVHRACAARCLSGGVPPGLLVRDGAGEPTVFLMAPVPGTSLDLDPQLAARTLRVEGILEVRDGLPVLFVAGWELLPEA